MLIYKIRDFRDDRTIFSNFFSHSKIIFVHRSTKMSLFGESWKSIIIEQKFKKFEIERPKRQKVGLRTLKIRVLETKKNCVKSAS